MNPTLTLLRAHRYVMESDWSLGVRATACTFIFEAACEVFDEHLSALYALYESQNDKGTNLSGLSIHFSQMAQ